MTHPFSSTTTATAAETAAPKGAIFEVVWFADQRRFSPPSHTGLLIKFAFSAAFVHHTQRTIYLLFIKNLLSAMASRAAKLRISDICVSVRGVGVTSHGPVRLVRLSCLTQLADPNNFCS